eukprot:1555970-Alexandrium_andersonii.AAC.1
MAFCWEAGAKPYSDISEFPRRKPPHGCGGGHSTSNGRTRHAAIARLVEPAAETLIVFAAPSRPAAPE